MSDTAHMESVPAAPSTSRPDSSTTAPASTSNPTSNGNTAAGTDTSANPVQLDQSGVSTAIQNNVKLLQELLAITNGNVDQAERILELLARLSPSSPQYGSGDMSSCGPPSTSAAVSANAAAAAAASAGGVTCSVAVPNSAATAVGVPPSLFTVGSTTSSTAVPLSDIKTLPEGNTTVTLNFSTSEKVDEMIEKKLSDRLVEKQSVGLNGPSAPSVSKTAVANGKGQEQRSAEGPSAASTTATPMRPAASRQQVAPVQKPRGLAAGGSLRTSKPTQDFPWKEGHE